MPRQLHRLLVLTLGWALIALGIVGLFLPILQGVLLILMGLYVLSRESRWARRQLRRVRARFPRADAKFREWKERARRRRRREGTAAVAEECDPEP